MEGLKRMSRGHAVNQMEECKARLLAPRKIPCVLLSTLSIISHGILLAKIQCFSFLGIARPGPTGLPLADTALKSGVLVLEVPVLILKAVLLGSQQSDGSQNRMNVPKFAILSRRASRCLAENKSEKED